jgi:hypothetical protein
MHFWITFATAVITAAITAVASDWAKRRFFGPELNIVYRGGEYGLFRTPTDSDTQAIYARVCVQNRGREVAIKCRAYLASIEQQRNQGQFEHIFFDCIPLCWSFLPKTEPQVLDIPRGVNVNLDVLTSNQGGNSPMPCVVILTLPYASLFSESGVYRMTVVVSPENGRPAIRQFLATLGAGWDRIELRPAD